MNAFLHDLRLALRQFRHRPGLWAAVVLTLALGIGANAAVFHVFERLLLAPLPYANDERLVLVYNTYPKNDLEYAGTSVPDYLDRKTQAPSLEDLGLFFTRGMTLLGGDEPRRVQITRATPSFFTTLGVQPALGAVFGEAEASGSGESVVVITHGLWQTAFGGSRDVLGRELKLDGGSWRVIGVLPPGFAVPLEESDAIVPAVFTPEQASDASRGNEFSASVGRLRAGAQISQLNAELDAIVKRNAERLPEDYRTFFDASGFTGRAKPLRQAIVGDVAGTLRMLQAATLLVLLIACANVANLLLAQHIARTREYAVRSAIGARSGDLMRQALAEAVLAALVGAAVGLLVAHAVLAAMSALAGNALLLRDIDPVLPWATQALTVVAALVLVPLIAALPIAFAGRTAPALRLRDAGRSGSGGVAAGRARSGLVVLQLALSSALLVAAGLLMRSYLRVTAESPGFSAQGVLTAFVELPESRYPEPVAQGAFFDRARAAAAAIPGVERTGWITGLPFTPFGFGASYAVRGLKLAPGVLPHAQIRLADGDYFKVMDIPVLRGRVFNEADRNGEPVVVIDELLAKKYFADRDPVGGYLARGDGQAKDTVWMRVIGVVGTVRGQSLAETPNKETIYAPVGSFPIGMSTLVLRTSIDPDTMAATLRRTLRELDPQLALYDVQTLDARIDASLGLRRAPLALVGAFASTALLLAVVGLYGVLAFVVGSRSGEIGLRMAIGARARDVVRMVVGQGVRLVGVGLALGLVLASLGGSVLSSQLFGISVFDPVTFAAVAAVLLFAALVACIAPARRAAAVDPIDALRSE
ncbi:MAG: ABC transporter permease [Xanthomonadales bacterium]|nr:ABC transporter permease [Xanthomonadales bacterium]